MPRLRISIVLLVAANLIPLFGVLFLGWDVFSILLLFWAENVVIGIFGLLKLRAASGSTFLTLFFTVHYGGFMMGHVVVLLAMFSSAGGGADVSLVGIDLLANSLLDAPTLIAVLALFVSHGWSYMQNFRGTNERSRLSGTSAMSLPYRRMVITHIALLGGGFFLTSMGEPLPGLMLLLVMKIAMDVFFHRREHSDIPV